MKKIISTSYDTAAAVCEDGSEVIAIPVYEDNRIELYRLPTGGAASVAGLLTLPDDAERISTYDFDEGWDSEDVSAKCREMVGIIRVYKVTVTHAYMISETGTRYSLTPWGDDTEVYKGYDDGGMDYLLPDDYELLECKGGGLEIYRKDTGEHVLFESWNGRPALVDMTLKGKHLILKKA